MHRLFLLLLFAMVAPANAVVRTATLDVKGMTCATCPLTVRQVLIKAAGVKEARVDFRNASAKVVFDDAATSIERLADAVTQAGFPTVPGKTNP